MIKPSLHPYLVQTCLQCLQLVLTGGYIRLSLVTIPVSIFNAVESASEISFREIRKPSGRRIN